jgi:hypothetical protein
MHRDPVQISIGLAERTCARKGCGSFAPFQNPLFALAAHLKRGLGTMPLHDTAPRETVRTRWVFISPVSTLEILRLEQPREQMAVFQVPDGCGVGVLLRHNS